MKAAKFSDAGRAVGVFLLLLGISLAFFRGSMESSDEQLMAATTQAIAERFSLTFDAPLYGQTFTGYGVGTPAVGVPMYFAEKLLRHTMLLRDANASIIPITNSLLFALLGVMLAGLAVGTERWAFTCLLMVVSPLLPASLTFYSELLATVGLVGVVMCLVRSTELDGEPPSAGALALMVFFGAAAMLARMAMLPLLVFAGVWGWRIGARRESVAALAAGCVAGVAGTLIQNWSLRGSPFATGYVGQDFTTPLLTGLYGIFLSPERGVLIFFPLMAMPFLCWASLDARARAFAVLAAAMTLFWGVMHATFWTWHGGWTAGPRFLLPCLALFVPPLVAVMTIRKRLAWHLRLLLALGLVWCGLMAFIYCRHSAFAWWHLAWEFHGQENEWLFIPQLSMWQAWFDGVPLGAARMDLPRGGELVLSTLCALCLIGGLVPVLRTLRLADFVETGTRFHVEVDRTMLAVLGIISCTLLVYGLSGPRGFAAIETVGGKPGNVQRLLLENRTGTYVGWIDNRLATPITFSMKANALYKISMNGETVLEQTKSMGHHLNTFKVDVEPGRVYQLRVEVERRPGEDGSLFQLFWTWGGNGYYLSPVGGEYVTPRPLSPTERFFSLLWRRKFLAGGAFLALLLLIKGTRRSL